MRQGCYAVSGAGSTMSSCGHNVVLLWTSGISRAILKRNNGTEQVAALSKIRVCVSKL